MSHKHADLSTVASFEEVAQLGELRVYLKPDIYHPDIVREIREGKYEGMERGALRTFLSPDDRVLELGSAIGVIAMQSALTIGADRVRSYDANPYMVEDAKKNAVLNGLDIDFRNGLLSPRRHFRDGVRSLPFYIHQAFWSSSLIKSTATIEIVEVPRLCAEDEISAWEANTVICDIEGAEIDLFTHMDLSMIDKIMMEIHTHVSKKGVDAMMLKLLNSGFTLDYALSRFSVVCLTRD